MHDDAGGEANDDGADEANPGSSDHATGDPESGPSDVEVVAVCVDRMVELVGRHRTVELVRAVDGVSVSDDGRVQSLDVDGRTAMDRLVTAFEPIGGDLVPTVLAGVVVDEFDAREVDLPDRIAVEIERAV